jgi:prepilin-type N-terminal cleavage/methylation domain-containing protein
MPGSKILRRPGFTLLELLLVLALVALSIAWTAPAWRQQLAQRRLNAAAEELRSAWQEARLRAVDSGSSLVFEFAPGTGQYRVRSLAESFARTSTVEGTQSDLERAPRNEASPSEPALTDVDATLPDGVVLLDFGNNADTGWPAKFSSDVPEDDVATALQTALEAAPAEPADTDAEPAEQDWLPAAVFFPTGQATDARLLAAAIDSQQLRCLTLRGLTGQVTIRDPAWPESLESE